MSFGGVNPKCSELTFWNFRVQSLGLGFRVLGYKVWELGSGVWGLGSTLKGAGQMRLIRQVWGVPTKECMGHISKNIQGRNPETEFLNPKLNPNPEPQYGGKSATILILDSGC